MLRKTKAKKNVFFFMILPKNGQKLPQMSNLGFFRVFWPKIGHFGSFREKKNLGKILADNK